MCVFCVVDAKQVSERNDSMTVLRNSDRHDSGIDLSDLPNSSCCSSPFEELSPDHSFVCVNIVNFIVALGNWCIVYNIVCMLCCNCYNWKFAVANAWIYNKTLTLRISLFNSNVVHRVDIITFRSIAESLNMYFFESPYPDIDVEKNCFYTEYFKKSAMFKVVD